MKNLAAASADAAEDASADAAADINIRQNTRPCAIDLAYDHTVTLYKSTLDIRQS